MLGYFNFWYIVIGQTRAHHTKGVEAKELKRFFFKTIVPASTRFLRLENQRRLFWECLPILPPTSKFTCFLWFWFQTKRGWKAFKRTHLLSKVQGATCSHFLRNYQKSVEKWPDSSKSRLKLRRMQRRWANGQNWCIPTSRKNASKNTGWQIRQFPKGFFSAEKQKAQKSHGPKFSIWKDTGHLHTLEVNHHKKMEVPFGWWQTLL